MDYFNFKNPEEKHKPFHALTLGQRMYLRKMFSEFCRVIPEKFFQQLQIERLMMQSIKNAQLSLGLEVDNNLETSIFWSRTETKAPKLSDENQKLIYTNMILEVCGLKKIPLELPFPACI